MKTEAKNELNHIGYGLIRCVIGKTLAEFPCSTVRSIELAKKAAPLPLSYPMLEGVVASDRDACLQLNLAESSIGPKSEAKYSVSLHTNKGVICLKVDSLETKDDSLKPHDFSKVIGIKEIENHIKEYKKIDSRNGNIDPLNQEKLISKSFVLCQSDGKIVGIDAKFVRNIERKFKIHTIDKRVSHERIIELEDKTLQRGISLKNWLNPDCSTTLENETWAIRLKIESTEVLLITEQLISLTDFNDSEFFKIQNLESESWWLSHNEYGPIEILDPHIFFKIEKPPLSNSKFAQPQTKSLPINAQKINALQSYIGIRCVTHDLVIPHSNIDSVGAIVNTNQLRKKRNGKSIPVYELSHYLESEHRESSLNNRLIILHSKRKRKIALLVPELYKPDTNKSWLTTGILPYPLNLFIKGVCISDSRAEYLIDENFINQISKPEFEKQVKNSFCGWLPL